MPNVNWGQHNYIDLSDLNAKWDQDFPGGYNEVYASPVHGLGTSNGILSGNALRIRGVGADPTYPWRQYSADTVALQKDLNDVLEEEGYVALDEDGVLGPATCGAARALNRTPPGTCQSFESPIAAPPDSADYGGGYRRAGAGGGGTWLIWGGAFALVAVGAAVMYTSK